MSKQKWIASLAALLFTVAAAGSVGAQDATPQHSPASSPAAGPRTGHVPVDGLEVYYEVHGSGPPLVLLHGALVGIDLSFGQAIPLLAQDRTVIAIEQQGHWRTADADRPLSYARMADDTAAVFDHLGIEQADVFGYSMGGTIALELAIRRPDLVRKLIVASATFGPDGMSPEVGDTIEQMTPEAFTGSGLPESYAAVAPDPDGWAGLVAKVQELVRGFEGIPTADIEAIEAPAMVVVGDADNVSLEHAVALFRLLGGGVPADIVGLREDQFVVLPARSHVGVAMSVGEWLVPTIVPFLDAPMPHAAG